MPQIVVHTKFCLVLSGSETVYAPGVYTVTDEVANHWFTKAFADVAVDPVVAAPAATTAPAVSTDPQKTASDAADQKPQQQKSAAKTSDKG